MGLRFFLNGKQDGSPSYRTGIFSYWNPHGIFEQLWFMLAQFLIVVNDGNSALSEDHTSELIALVFLSLTFICCHLHLNFLRWHVHFNCITTHTVLLARKWVWRHTCADGKDFRMTDSDLLCSSQGKLMLHASKVIGDESRSKQTSTAWVFSICLPRISGFILKLEHVLDIIWPSWVFISVY